MLYLVDYTLDSSYHISTMQLDKNGFMTILSLDTGEIKKVNPYLVKISCNNVINCYIELKKGYTTHRVLYFEKLEDAILASFSAVYLLEDYQESYLYLADNNEFIYSITKNIIETLINS